MSPHSDGAMSISTHLTRKHVIGRDVGCRADQLAHQPGVECVQDAHHTCQNADERVLSAMNTNSFSQYSLASS